MIQAVNWTDMRAVVFDLDGTLYRQTPVRIVMGAKLILHSLTCKNGLRDMSVLKNYRRFREELADLGAHNISLQQFQNSALYHGLGEIEVKAIVDEWMEIKAYSIIRQFRHPDVDTFFRNLKSMGKKIGILSDYPIKNKLKALELEADAICCSTEDGVDRLKPDPTGLKKLLRLLDVPKDKCVLIGDRVDRDGACAASIGMPFILCSNRHFYTRQLILLSNRG